MAVRLITGLADICPVLRESTHGWAIYERLPGQGGVWLLPLIIGPRHYRHGLRQVRRACDGFGVSLVTREVTLRRVSGIRVVQWAVA
jgi:hypothetical protein